jgi:hypothetical protein
MIKKEEMALLIFERKIFRRIYGPKYEHGGWRTRTNRELEDMNKGENTVKWIKGQRISWLGHLERMEENRMPKMIFSQELEEMSKGENTVKWIKGQRISWLGHLERMEENRIPKMIFSQELEEMSKGENIVKWIKGQRISWLGHLERMEENRMPKMIFSQELGRPRRRGRPRKRWKEEVERNLHVLGVRRWRELATDRKEWQDIVRQAKAHSGL